MNTTPLKSGFTLIETLVAVTVLVVAITGPLTLAHRGVASAGYAKQQMTATYLAQEAVEYVHNYKADIINDNIDFTDQLAQDFFNCYITYCYFDIWEIPPGISKGACNTPTTCPRVQFNTVTKRYGHYETGSDWIDSQFIRRIRLASVPGNADEILMTVDVTWGGGFAPTKTITVIESFFDTN